MANDDDLDPVQVALDTLLRTPQARDVIDRFQRLLDRAGDAIERGPRRRPPRRPPTPPPPQIKRQDPRLAARAILHFDAQEPLDKEKISKRRRKLAALCHPDQGGSTEAMMKINNAADVLLASL